MDGETVKVIVRFLTIMQKYSDGKRDVGFEVPREPLQAMQHIIEIFQIPWKDNLEKSTRIFINKEYANTFIEKGELLTEGDLIIFTPISGGG